MTIYTLSPSDLTFAWDGCKRCFYLKIKHNLSYQGTFPAMFGKMGSLTSNFYHGKACNEISSQLPVGIINLREKWVKSAPIGFAGTEAQVVIRGRFDAIAAFADGSYGVIDYKTSEASPGKADFYGRQLSAYAYALENPAPGALGLAPVSRLGLFVITPQRFERTEMGEMAFITAATWLDVPRDDAGFLGLLAEVVSLLDQPAPPQGDKNCGLCKYLKAYKEAGF